MKLYFIGALKCVPSPCPQRKELRVTERVLLYVLAVCDDKNLNQFAISTVTIIYKIHQICSEPNYVSVPLHHSVQNTVQVIGI